MFVKLKQVRAYFSNATILENYSKLKPSAFIIPIVFLAALVLFLYSQNALSVEQYPLIQKNYFLSINAALSQYPNLILNITQIGDTLVLLSLFSIALYYTPKIWESFISATIVAAIFSRGLKSFFSIPRPLQVYDVDSFVIIGRRMPGFSSFPSGHTITTFSILIVLLFSFMPKKYLSKALWCIGILALGYMIAFTRVGVGAHHPLDVISGSAIGYLSALIGIFITRKYNIWAWVGNQKYYPFFMVLFVVSAGVMLFKIYTENLIVYYLTLVVLFFSLYKMYHVYFKK
ncbi:phosphatase PAP2 family protein [Flavobacterium capsici]|uniref:Phosphatase PAP2 family protein n=1 Tax=Flavobacterium capsici TaxID=3075618 RepID=A0AA96J608_9FLAO|nr:MULTISPECIES: phosphatase PAP2 family protein [unclassified Flavobacterium]WNM18177.1 phosphatase PAP2 family protein [Flavobacterium sp. PMR2A8]WNM22228.1 phosphatase PAP2 family protein [Flavobacterium sp. PMTSA4]